MYIWPREAPAPASKTSMEVTKPQPQQQEQQQGTLAQTSRPGHTGSKLGVDANANDLRSSPAYYPPRDLRQTQQQQAHPQGSQSGSGINVRPLRTLEGHGDGAVFGVRWYQGGILSAGEDGAVGMWGFEEEDEGSQD